MGKGKRVIKNLKSSVICHCINQIDSTQEMWDKTVQLVIKLAGHSYIGAFVLRVLFVNKIKCSKHITL